MLMLKSKDDDVQELLRYKFLFEGTSDMIFFFDSNGKVAECNSCVGEQLGFEEGDELWIQDLFRTDFRDSKEELDFSEDMLEQYRESTIYRKNQTCFPVQVRITLLPEETGRFGICRANSVSQQKLTTRRLVHAEKEVEEAHKERNEFVANVTHELRTPVNGVMGLAQTLLDTQLDSEQRETVEIIDQCCKNMIKIINNILDFSKLEAGKFTIENREFSFHDMMDKMLKMNLPSVESKGLRLVCNVSEDIPDRMIGDELRLTQVLNNLLSNAVKFTSVGQIVVNVIKSLDMPGEMELFFMVIDSGIGISDSERDKLFKSFSQVDASITRQFGGTGLGLSIVKTLVQMMGGEINVESEKGKGSTFSFSIRVEKVVAESTEDIENIVPAKAKSDYTFHIGDMFDSDEEAANDIFRLGTAKNLQELANNMEKLVLCIEMENWTKADSFADIIKQLVAEDALNLKRKAFRLQMTLRKGDHDQSMEQYLELKEGIDALEELS